MHIIVVCRNYTASTDTLLDNTSTLQLTVAATAQEEHTTNGVMGINKSLSTSSPREQLHGAHYCSMLQPNCKYWHTVWKDNIAAMSGPEWQQQGQAG